METLHLCDKDLKSFCGDHFPLSCILNLGTFDPFSRSQESMRKWSNLYFPVFNMSQLNVRRVSSVQFKKVSMRSENPIGAPPCLSEVSPAMSLIWFQCSSDWQWPSFVFSQFNLSRGSKVSLCFHFSGMREKRHSLLWTWLWRTPPCRTLWTSL